jgi:hypothetical protein
MTGKQATAGRFTPIFVREHRAELPELHARSGRR